MVTVRSVLPVQLRPYEVSVLRAFIAIQLPTSIQDSLERYLDQLQSALSPTPIGWIPAKNIHLTLKFLGDIPPDLVEPILAILKQAAGQSTDFELGIRGLGCFPQPRRPRILWLGVEPTGSQLMKLQHEMDAALESLNFKPEGRRFHPHLTLGRVKKSARLDQIETLSRRLTLVEQPDFGTFKAQSIHLIRSELRSQGAVYTQLGSVILGERS
ncbi:MAG: RNA 2',3'-cyclic phosphodiesterase [Anaerolineales bacterium]|nr:MAG: RNA 2',3'-cyclic phosphodiesterase [Anaerolineales bacterium]